MRIVGALLLLGSFPVPTMAASPIEALEGRLDFASALLVGETVATTSSLGAGHAIASPLGLEGWLEISASKMVVNWSRSKSLGVGNYWGDPNASLVQHYQERSNGTARFALGSATSRVHSSDAAWLAVPKAGVSVSLHSNSSSPIVAELAHGQEWAAGEFENSSFQSEPRFLVRSFFTVPGQPVLRSSENGLKWTVRGDLVLFVWGFDLSVNDAAETRTYRTGAWWENATGPGPRGAAREEYAQLVELDLTNATVTWNHQSGIAQWIAPQVSTQTKGYVFLKQAHGVLESTTHRYELMWEDLRVDGDVALDIGPGKTTTSQLATRIHASNAQLNVEPDFAIRRRAGLQGLSPWWYVLASFGLAAMAFGAISGLPRIHSAMDWTIRLVAAENLLIRGRPAQAARTAQKILRRRPQEGHAWFLYGAALMKQDAFEKLVRDLEPVARKVTERASLSLLLGLAHLRLGNRAKARRWFARAEEDPELLDYLRRNPPFASRSFPLKKTVGTNVDPYA